MITGWPEAAVLIVLCVCFAAVLIARAYFASRYEDDDNDED